MAATSPPGRSLWALAQRNAALRPDRLGVAGPGQRCTGAELLARVDAIAAAIERHGLSPGDRVCVCLPSSPEWVAAFLALRRLGLTGVSIGARARPAELDALITRFGVRLVIGPDEARPTGIPASRPGDATAALIHLTSGSSGTPKGVPRSEADLSEEARNVAAALNLTPDDAVLCATPVYHSFASGLLTACLHAGAACLLMDRLAPATMLDLAARHGATIIAGVPYVFQTLTALAGDVDAPSLRLAISGGAPLRPETARRFAQRFGAPLVQEYGLSEAGIVTLNLDGPPDSAGAPIVNVELRIADPEDVSRELPPGVSGEVVVRRAFPPTKYLDHPNESVATFTPHGVRSGDLGRLDAEGRLTLTGRIKAMINVAGAKVAPREVEEALLAHAAVAEAAVFGVPGSDLGETVAAVVVAGRDAAVTEQALRAHCRERLSPYKIPSLIEIRAGLPRTVSGKPDLPRIRREFMPRRIP